MSLLSGCFVFSDQNLLFDAKPYFPISNGKTFFVETLGPGGGGNGKNTLKADVSDVSGEQKRVTLTIEGSCYRITPQLQSFRYLKYVKKDSHTVAVLSVECDKRESEAVYLAGLKRDDAMVFAGPEDAQAFLNMVPSQFSDGMELDEWGLKVVSDDQIGMIISAISNIATRGKILDDATYIDESSGLKSIVVLALNPKPFAKFPETSEPSVEQMKQAVFSAFGSLGFNLYENFCFGKTALGQTYMQCISSFRKIGCEEWWPDDRGVERVDCEMEYTFTPKFVGDDSAAGQRHGQALTDLFGGFGSAMSRLRPTRERRLFWIEGKYWVTSRIGSTIPN